MLRQFVDCLNEISRQDSRVCTGAFAQRSPRQPAGPFEPYANHACARAPVKERSGVGISTKAVRRAGRTAAKAKKTEVRGSHLCLCFASLVGLYVGYISVADQSINEELRRPAFMVNLRDMSIVSATHDLAGFLLSTTDAIARGFRVQRQAIGVKDSRAARIRGMRKRNRTHPPRVSAHKSPAAVPLH